jgi:lysophospholipase L1-like esterase
MRVRTITLPAAAVVLCACGGGGPSAPTKIPTHTVTAVAFYDENQNGVRDSQESVRIPNVQVTIGGVTGKTDATGRATLTVPEGQQTLLVVTESLPPYFQAAAVPLTVPAVGDVGIPTVLPLGGRMIRNKYMGFGDSLTYGTYEGTLETQLRAYFGAAQVVDEGLSGTRSDVGARRIGDALDYARPAATLILYGTNDWNELACKDDRFPCYTIDSLRTMIREARSVGSLPFLATLPGVNVGFNEQAPPEREDWTKRINEEIRKLARAENVVLVDLHKAFLAAPNPKSLFIDYVHHSREGQNLVAQEFFKAITTRAPAAATNIR